MGKVSSSLPLSHHRCWGYKLLILISLASKIVLPQSIQMTMLVKMFHKSYIFARSFLFFFMETPYKTQWLQRSAFSPTVATSISKRWCWQIPLNAEQTESPTTVDFSFQVSIKGTRAVAHHEHEGSKQKRLKMNATYAPLTWSCILWECWLFIKSKPWIWRHSVNTTKGAGGRVSLQLFTVWGCNRLLPSHICKPQTFSTHCNEKE